MKNPIIIPITNLKEKPYATILCYPRASEAELQMRITELQKHGVEALEFSGKTSVCNVPVLGKGFVGVAVVAILNGERTALKIRRVDADRAGLQKEATMLAKANSVNVGPTLISASTNFLLMQFVDGDFLPDWLESHTYVNRADVRSILRKIMEQCWRLDTASLDHGELSKAPKHVIVNMNREPFIVDFETASIHRKPTNVTAICQYFFAGKSAVARITAEILGETSLEGLVKALRLYKHNRTRGNFERVLKVCFTEN